MGRGGGESGLLEGGTHAPPLCCTAQEERGVSPRTPTKIIARRVKDRETTRRRPDPPPATATLRFGAPARILVGQGDAGGQPRGNTCTRWRARTFAFDVEVGDGVVVGEHRGGNTKKGGEPKPS